MATNEEERAPNAEQTRRAIGKRIINARNEAGMRQTELAELLGVSERTMQAYESGEVVPYKRLRELERFLNRPMAWFLHGEAAVNQRDSQLDELRDEIHVAVRQNERRDQQLAEISDVLKLILAALKD